MSDFEIIKTAAAGVFEVDRDGYKNDVLVVRDDDGWLCFGLRDEYALDALTRNYSTFAVRQDVLARAVETIKASPDVADVEGYNDATSTLRKYGGDAIVVYRAPCGESMTLDFDTLEALAAWNLDGLNDILGERKYGAFGVSREEGDTEVVYVDLVDGYLCFEMEREGRDEALDNLTKHGADLVIKPEVLARALAITRSGSEEDLDGSGTLMPETPTTVIYKADCGDETIVDVSVIEQILAAYAPEAVTVQS